ncbi:hypothetical protein [Chryseobacterium sp. CCH4-E10]|jgi:methyl coenzyme M reductase subunit C-like uncharacterized protein (methanogenesis marker protein 7)|uniref:hypothetical protein n=1 Tax=Chryseobacterium sp. CCH4-E10 TaxID=1768758 RepID=UPI00082CEBFD|nr:hypothetical protein [Chryseobacterium sp. CCH4-E10]
METLAKQLRKTVKFTTPYQEIAAEFDTDPLYVGQIARGERKPIRGKGLKILNKIKELTQNKDNEKNSKNSTESFSA